MVADRSGEAGIAVTTMGTPEKPQACGETTCTEAEPGNTSLVKREMLLPAAAAEFEQETERVAIVAAVTGWPPREDVAGDCGSDSRMDQPLATGSETTARLPESFSFLGVTTSDAGCSVMELPMAVERSRQFSTARSVFRRSSCEILASAASSCTWLCSRSCKTRWNFSMSSGAKPREPSALFRPRGVLLPSPADAPWLSAVSNSEISSCSHSVPLSLPELPWTCGAAAAACMAASHPRGEETVVVVCGWCTKV
mmetsp:Transcript_107523/g.342899  ORF Transcript_107523/g.342899 Transcript_107523/m.342899 type:complete len:254 (+) Transcript_107523:471-1232(+)